MSLKLSLGWSKLELHQKKQTCQKCFVFEKPNKGIPMLCRYIWGFGIMQTYFPSYRIHVIFLVSNLSLIPTLCITLTNQKKNIWTRKHQILCYIKMTQIAFSLFEDEFVKLILTYKYPEVMSNSFKWIQITRKILNMN